MDASSLNIFCPEHNQYVQYVCLVNQCYQKLMCELCLKKHKEVHKNMHTPLMEMINNLKRFMKVKLEDDENLTNLHEQIRNGARTLRTQDSKPSEIDYVTMQCVDGKDQEQKYNMFNEKSQLNKNTLITKEVKIFTDELHLCLQSQQKKVLNFERTIMESMQNQLKRATSRKVLEEKFLKDSAIQTILDDLKNNNDRYNQLNKNLQKLHKGFLELKISKKIFRDMCIDTQQRFRIFTKNISSYFDSEYQKLFAFMIDTNDAIIEQAQLEKQLQSDQLLSPSLNSPNLTNNSLLSPDLSKQLKLIDKKDPNVYMSKMIDDLKKINIDIRKSSLQTEKYAPDVEITGINSMFSFTPERQKKEQSQFEDFTRNNGQSQFAPQFGSFDLKNMLSTPQTGTPSRKKILLNQISTYSPQTNNIPKIQRTEMLQRVNYQKKEFKMNLERIETMRFNNIQTQFAEMVKLTSQAPVSLKSLQFLYTIPQIIQNQRQQSSISQQQLSTNSLNQSNSPTKKSVNFRIHKSNQSSNGGQKISQPSKYIEQELTEASDMNKGIIAERALSKQLTIINQQLLRKGTGGSSFSISMTKEQIMQLQSVYESTICYEMSTLTDYKTTNVLQLSINPYLRTYGFLEQLNLQFSNYSHPFSSLQNRNINIQKMNKEASANDESEIEVKRNDNSFLMSYKREEQSIMIGLEELSNSKFVSLHQNGLISVWQLNMSSTSMNVSISKLKDINISKYIYCYAEANSNEDIQTKNINQANTNEFDPILIIAGQNDLNETTLTILRYESKKNKFNEIDSFKSYHGSGAISQIQVIGDKQFQKKNIPNSLQLSTDAYYVFTLNLFDFDEEIDLEESNLPTIPTILVQRIQFHRDKHGSTERTLITKIKIKNNLIIQKIMYDTVNDCLWGHSDYMLFKWRINFMSKCLENQQCITLCTHPNDIITSMHSNNSIIMLSSLQGNIWGVDVMLNKVISTDFQRIKYSSINHYSKIQGKDPIYIISGSKIYLTSNSIRQISKKPYGINQEEFYKTNSSTNSTQFNATNTSTTQKSKEQQQSQQIFDCEYYFLYSTLSQSGVKVFCFDSEFKEVISTFTGQENHLQQIISLNKENLILSIEDFNAIRIWKNDYI